MTPADALRAYALLGIPAGLASGLVLGLVARREGGWGGYGSFHRRAARLGHVCLVMLPMLAGAYSLWLGGVPAPAPALAAGTVLWIAGGPALAAALFVTAWRPALRASLVVPALAVVAGAVLFAAAGLA